MKKFVIVLAALIVLSGWQAYAVEVESLGVDIHGFVSQGFLKSTNYNYLANDSNKGSFQFNEMGINFGKQVTDQLRIGAQFFARDLGDVANNKVTVDWAYGDYSFKEWLGVRAGRIKIPFGLYGDIRDMDMLRTCIILPQGIYDDLLRDAMLAMNGASVYGTIPMSKAGSLEYQAQIGVANMDADSGIGKYIASSISTYSTTVGSFNTHTIYAGGLRWNTPLPGLSLKGTLLISESDVPITVRVSQSLTLSGTMNMKNKRQVYSAEYIWKDLTLVAEFMTNMSDNSSSVGNFGYRNESYYGMATYRFTGWLEAGAYYSEHYPDASASGKNGDKYIGPGEHNFWAWQKDAAVFARFDVNSYLNLKIEGHYVDGVGDVLDVDNRIKDDKNWWYFAAKATFSF